MSDPSKMRRQTWAQACWQFAAEMRGGYYFEVDIRGRKNLDVRLSIERWWPAENGGVLIVQMWIKAPGCTTEKFLFGHSGKVFFHRPPRKRQRRRRQ